ncbi:MAG: hypothetical protein UW69_C0039G0008 [Microgenomates group bacterium GW2011_GWA2_44_7]|nr:MAG: hypothetical protein UW69_C0039G0008 [Microgenomates group bacterium GW2011_GWA2_44_7]
MRKREMARYDRKLLLQAYERSLMGTDRLMAMFVNFFAGLGQK